MSFCNDCGHAIESGILCAICRSPKTATAESQTRLRLLFGIGAIVLLAMLFAALFIPAAPSPTYAATPSAHSVKAQAPAAVDASPWKSRITANAMDDTQQISFFLDADAPVHAWLKDTTPTLIVRCRASAPEIYIVNNTAANVEFGEYHNHHVRLRFDSKPALRQAWSESVDSEALFSPAPKALLAELVRTKTLIYEFTPFNGPGPTTTTFTINDLANQLKQHSACGYKS